MIVQLCGLFVIEALSLFGITRFKLKNEFVIPLTVMSMCLTLFLFGMLGILRVGVYFLLVLSILSVAYTLLSCVRKKRGNVSLSTQSPPRGNICHFLLCSMLF